MAFSLYLVCLLLLLTIVRSHAQSSSSIPASPLVSLAEQQFDRQSWLLVRLVRFVESPLGRNPTQIDYADYRATDGVTIPFRWTLSRPGASFTIQVDHLEQNVPIDDAQFVPPPPRAESSHQLSPHQ